MRGLRIEKTMIHPINCHVDNILENLYVNNVKKILGDKRLWVELEDYIDF
jgi:hypothetical protein